MKSVVYYDESNALTHISIKQVKDNYVLQAGEVWELPSGFLTPAKLVNGVLTSATQEESQQASEAYLKAHPELNQNKGVSASEQISALTQMLAQSQVTNMQTQSQVKALQMMVMAQNKQIMTLKGAK